jgi:hypothetical protein
MKTVIRKLFWDYEKEERWLNEQAAAGLAFVKYTWGTYTFEECEKGEYHYRLEYLEHTKTDAKGKAYLQFMADAGIELIQTYRLWGYFRKKAANGPFDIFSDLESKIKHYRRIQSFYAVMTVAELAMLLSQILLHVTGNPPSGFRIVILSLLIAVAALMGFVAVKYQLRINRLVKEKLVRE